MNDHILQPSRACIDLIKRFEQCRLHAYLPTPQDVPTIGWGSTGLDIRLGMTWTQEQADARFLLDVARFADKVEKLLQDGAATTQGEFDALVSLAYNIGTGNLASSTLLRMHKAGDKAGAAAQFARWNKQKGKVLNGLTIRRAAEASLYRGVENAADLAARLKREAGL
jgi:lysozyme